MEMIKTKTANAIRVLSADAIEKAKSGHPGLPLGCASIAYELWAEHMKHNPADPQWADRDRFVLSGGHGSMLLYSLFHLFGYGNLSIEDIKNFRQTGSLTPGHPEYGHTVGVEATTGPLGQGMGMAVGMAMAEAHLAAVFNKEDCRIVDHYTYVLGGDGCMMEGLSSEAFSLAGTLGLGKLIVIYDSNKISIEGDTDIAFTEDVAKRMEAYGFGVFRVEDGNDFDAIGAALEAAKADTERPSVIIVRTQIGYGCPAKQGKASAHGEPLGGDNVLALKENIGWESKEPFFVPQDVYDHMETVKERLKAPEEAWKARFAQYCEKYPEMKELWDQYHDRTLAEKLYDQDEFWTFEDKPQATRNISGELLNRINKAVPNLFGGSADLAPSNKTALKGEGDFSREDRAGKNLHFGVREQDVATFFVFSDYMKPVARLSSLMKAPLTYVLTHDSIGVGEDGPTHEPIEQLAMLRSMPNFHVFRPADARETAAAWYAAVTSKETPTALVLTRQNLPQLEGTGKAALKGAYVLEDSSKETPDAIIIATGSEVSLAVEARKLLLAEGMDVRVVSMPCMDVFEEQTAEYKESVLPKAVRKRVAVEALSDFGWGRYIGLDGASVCMEGFGASGPANELFEKFGFTAAHVAEVVKSL